ncbi:hypothetical protein Ocin01_05550, partial [Orchesella cincta]
LIRISLLAAVLLPEPSNVDNSCQLVATSWWVLASLFWSGLPNPMPMMQCEPSASWHAGSDEPVDQQARTIRVPGGDKHVNIIFVKTPSSSSSQQTEVILPDQDEHKNLVYVLLKKGEASSDIKIRRPQAQRPQKPEVYFIRYKGQEQQQGGGNGGYQQQAPAPIPQISRQPQGAYGAPF